MSKCLLPLIFSLNEVTDRSRGIDLSAWSVQDFYLEGKSSSSRYT